MPDRRSSRRGPAPINGLLDQAGRCDDARSQTYAVMQRGVDLVQTGERFGRFDLTKDPPFARGHKKRQVIHRVLAAPHPDLLRLEQVIESIAHDPGVLPTGMTFVSGTPSEDGSTITIGVATDGTESLRSATLPKQVEGVDVQFVEDELATLTARSRTSAPLISGGQTWRGTGVGTCTQGFPVLRWQDSQPNSLTADHCTAAVNEDWRWGGGSVSIGKSTFQAAGDTDLELYTDAGTLSAWMLVGTNTDSSTVAPIRGYVAPVGGNNVCYNGSRSGLVCSNTLESSDVYSCISSGFLQCYWTRWSTQSSGTPSSGNGDSGGPVTMFGLRESDQTIGAYGVGVISMMSNPGTTCTGDPSTTTRKCSANNGMAPLNRWASAQSTHNLVYTTS